jgi:aminopeptidase N
LIKVPLNPSLPIGSDFTAQIFYYGNGQSSVASGYNGISNGTSFNSSITYTYSEPFWSRIWWPCKQALGDKADSIHFYITTESDCKAGSNGLLKSVIPLPYNKVRYEWESNYPIDYYLVSFAVGQYIEHISYATIESLSDSILIQSYLIQDCPYLSTQLTAIEITKDYMQLFSNFFGDYPFKNEKYGYCVTPNPWGAMEHQTMTTTGYEALDTTAAFIVGYYYFWYSAHELGHSWFGDNVTCATWQDIWINEGFAGYSEYLALQYLESQDRADFWMSDAHSKTLSEPGGSVYIPDEFSNDEDRIFDYRLTYKKGAAIVHMIRFELDNDSLFFQTLKNFQNQFQYNVASGLDFKDVLEQTTGKNFDDFFTQWYFGEGYPIYNINWTQMNDTLLINSTQTTSTSVTPLFKMQLELKLHFAGGDTTIRINQMNNTQSFQIYFPLTVTNITADPNNWVIDQSTTIHTGFDDNQFNVESFYLYQNYPNPFNPSTTIEFDLPKSSQVTLKIYNIIGEEVNTLLSASLLSGSYKYEWDGSNLASGVYLYRLEAEGYVETRKMVLMR